MTSVTGLTDLSIKTAVQSQFDDLPVSYLTRNFKPIMKDNVIKNLEVVRTRTTQPITATTTAHEFQLVQDMDRWIDLSTAYIEMKLKVYKTGTTELTASDVGSVDPLTEILRQIIVHVNGTKIDQVDNLSNVIWHRIRTTASKRWVQTQGVSMGFYLDDDCGTAGSIENPFTANTAAAGVGAYGYLKGGIDGTNGWVVPELKNAATGIIVPDKYLHPVSKPRVDFYKNIVAHTTNSIFVRIPLHWLSGFFESCGQFLNFERIKLDLYTKAPSSGAALGMNLVKYGETGTYALQNLEMVYDVVQFNEAYEATLRKHHDIPQVIPFVRYLHTSNTLSTNTSQHVLEVVAAPINIFHWITLLPDEAKNEYKRSDYICLANFVKKRVRLDGATLRDVSGLDENDTSTYRYLDAYREWLSATQIDENNKMVDPCIDYTEFLKCHFTIATKLNKAIVLANSGGSLFDLDPRPKRIEIDLTLQTAPTASRNTLHQLIECESLTTVTRSYCTSHINSA